MNALTSVSPGALPLPILPRPSLSSSKVMVPDLSVSMVTKIWRRPSISSELSPLATTCSARFFIRLSRLK